MMIHCPNCNCPYEVNTYHYGKRLECDQCKNIFTVPFPAEPEVTRPETPTPVEAPAQMTNDAENAPRNITEPEPTPPPLTTPKIIQAPKIVHAQPPVMQPLIRKQDSPPPRPCPLKKSIYRHPPQPTTPGVRS